jgi:osmotically inducible protein OsmC
MPVSKASAEWKGNLREGKGRIAAASGLFEGPYSFNTRTEGGAGETTPEELIGAAHAGCYSMALAANLTRNNTPPEMIRTEASVHLVAKEGGFAIARIELSSRARVRGVEPAKFAELAEAAKRDCPVSKALTGVEIQLNAELQS